VHDLGSNGWRGELAGDAAWSWSEPVFEGAADEPPAAVVEVVVLDDDVADVDVVVDVPGFEAGTTAKSDPVTTATWAPAGTGP